ncbi:NAD(P)/FAD-dependent oxidoreductase [Psychroflexus montanilacus]|uniref:NAD(P)/FAD-dependent oxidoreductase n=1 Tax=Psychroflexus montanilacus TaxID=2873598 RepID=UPI001CCAA667|nr:FAD-binding oxidoreductase [Psychroflexus montanilacus]MBZ9651454.1 FAD-binding oxidoreductase [Psychroflexus montanilacus]
MKDVLIVGFGIAGLTLAKRLELKSKTFDIISDESQQSSKVAGGVLNPVALKRYNLAWNAEKLMPEAIQFYSQFNQNSTYFEAITVYKLFSSIEDQNNWIVASDQPRLEPFLNSKIQSLDAQVQTNFKSGEVLQSHLLHLKNLLQNEKLRYSESSQFFSNTFRYERLSFNRTNVEYLGVEYKSVVFCEGFGVAENPFFNWLPIYGNKGEYLIFKSERLNANSTILKSRNFIIPLGNDLYKYGATYSREGLNDKPSQEARMDLESKLSEMIDCDFEIVDQVAGVRPTVRDRKPIVGQHPEHKNLFILNGFGSRGVMAAPHLSKQLIDFIFENKEMDKEISLSRFLKFYA